MRKVIVTGGAQGIGKATCKYLSNSGFKVYAFDIDNEALSELNNEMPELITFSGDVSNEEDIKKITGMIGKEGLAGIVNNAAVSINKKITDISLTEWNNVLAVNLTGAFLMAKYTYHLLKENKGSIVNIASTRALMSEPDTEAYSSSKGGLVALTHALAMSFAPDIRVNCISPGWIEVGDFKKGSAKMPVLHTEADITQHPVGRVGLPDDIATMVEYLLSDKSGFITGQNFIIDGGMTKKMIYV